MKQFIYILFFLLGFSVSGQCQLEDLAEDLSNTGNSFQELVDTENGFNAWKTLQQADEAVARTNPAALDKVGAVLQQGEETVASLSTKIKQAGGYAKWAEKLAEGGGDLFSTFTNLGKLKGETKSLLSAKGWEDDVLTKLDGDLGSDASNLFKHIDANPNSVDSWNSLRKAGFDDLARNPIQLQKFDEIVTSNNLGLDAVGLENLLKAKTATKNLPWEHPDKILDAVKRGSDGGVDGISIKGFPEPADGNTSFVLSNAKQYQKEASGDALLSFDKNGVSFDNVTPDGKLIDRKYGHGSSVFNADGSIKNQSRVNSILEQGQRQLNASGGTPVRWEVSTELGADGIQDVFDNAGFDIEVIYVPQLTIIN